jgi:predicted DNA-binding transcriptional regulator YafY
MHNQNKLARVLKLMVLLKTTPPKSIRNLARMLDTTSRTIYRYMDLLQDVGFLVSKDDYGKYQLEFEPALEIQILKQDEISFLQKLLLHHAGSPLSQSIMQKLPLSIPLSDATEWLGKAMIAQTIERLSEALEHKKQVVLQGYFSASSQTVRDRTVEPIRFTDDYQMLSAYDLEHKEVRLFSIQRISSVQIEEQHWQFDDVHHYQAPDIFGFQKAGDEDYIELDLSPRAYLFLMKEYPAAQTYLRRKRRDERYSLLAPVHDFKAPARFVLGLPHELRVLGSPSFKNYLSQTFQLFFEKGSS